MAVSARLVLIIMCFNCGLCIVDETIWHSHQFQYGNKEELIVTGVVSEEDFILKDDILRWKCISLSTKGYSVGLMSAGFILVVVSESDEENKFVTKIIRPEFNSTVVDVQFFKHWNEGKLEIFLILATDGANPSILFYKIQDESLQLFRTWHMHKKITHLRYFNLLDDNKGLLILYEDPQGNTADFYEFTLEDFWHLQTLPLASAPNSTAINTFGVNLFLSIPQLDKVLVYKLEPTKKFHLYQTLSSKNVFRIDSFNIGVKSFLAIGGDDAGIFQFSRSGLVWEKIDALNLKDVDFWLPVKTYRDEVVLILQRSVYHGSHTSFFLEVVLYDGKKFVPHEEISCSFYGDFEYGLTCMVDEEGADGLLGAGVITLRNALGAFVPRKGHSSLFMIRTIVRTLKNPVEMEVEKLLETRRKLQKQLDEEFARFALIQERLKNAVKLDKETTITAPWTIQTLAAPAFADKSKTPAPVESLTLENVNIEDLEKGLSQLKDGVEEAKNKLATAVDLNQPALYFDNLVLDGELIVMGQSYFESVEVQTFNDEIPSDAFNDLVTIGNFHPISGQKTFSDIQVENVTFEVLNGIEISEIIPDDGRALLLNQTVVFDELVTIMGEIFSKSGQINDLDLSNEIVEMNKKYEDPLEFEHIKVDNAEAGNLPILKQTHMDDTSFYELDALEMEVLKVAGNITVENVNGENFNDFLKTICFTNIDTYIPDDVYIEGNLNVAESLNVDFLNQLKFPQEFVMANSRLEEISGKKLFEATVFAESVLIRETINGIPPTNILIPSKNQSLPGTFSFDNLEVSETMSVDGKFEGPYMSNFLENPTLSESNLIRAKVNFQSLEVVGNVFISDKFNNVGFGEMLKDVVHGDEEEVTITGVKNFLAGFTVTNGLDVASAAIGDVAISSFITKDTEQIIAMGTLNGPVHFRNLLLGGLYGDINVTKLEQETVKLTGEQFVGSTLIFLNDDVEAVDFSATDLTILSTLNNLTSRDYFFTTDESRSLNGPLEFERLVAENIFIDGDLVGEIPGFSLESFDASRLSYTRDQVISSKYTVKNFQCDHMKTDFINGQPFDRPFNSEYYAAKLSRDLFEGKLKIKNLYVNGSVYARTINGINVNDLAEKCVWLDQNNNFDSALFEGNVFMNTLQLKNFNNVDFKLFADNLVLKSDLNPVIGSFKIFENGIHVTRMLNSVRLNNVHVDDILMKSGAQEVLGPLNIHGNVVVNGNSEIFENLNGIPVRYLTQTYQFVDGKCIINDDLIMQRLAYINKLEVDGHVNGENLNEFFSDIVYKTDSKKFSGIVTFANNVELNKNLIVTDKLNGVDFSDFVQDVVLITNDDLIEVAVTFANIVRVQEDLRVESDMQTELLMGLDLDAWKNKAVFINQGEIPGNLSFESVTIQGNAVIKYLNELNLNTLIPLRSDQYISQTMKFWELTPFFDVEVGETVNGYVLPEEYARTYFVNGIDQVLSQKIIFQGFFLVENNLEIFGHVNGKNISKMVTTNTDQNLTATYFFKDTVVFKSNLYLNGLLNGIDLYEWQKKSVMKFREYPQSVYDAWKVEGNLTFNENIDGQGLIDGIDVRKMAEEVEGKRNFKRKTEIGLKTDYVNICKDVNAITDASQNQIYLFQYIELLQTLEIRLEIASVHHFKHQNSDYLILSESGSCLSHLFVWSQARFQEIGPLVTGHVLQFISVYDGELLFLVSRGVKTIPNCEMDGTNVWKFEETNLSLMYKLEDQKILQESLMPRTFYGLKEHFVVEYRIETDIETNVRKVRKWVVNGDNLVFVPRGLATGLALCNGLKLFRLIQENNDENLDVDIRIGNDGVSVGRVLEEVNAILPGYNGDNAVILNVGYGGTKRSLVAIASHEDTSVKGRLDFIKIYEDVMKGKIFHKVPAYKPSSLVSMELQNGETLLMFLEDQKEVRVYEYKGVEGFNERAYSRFAGSKLLILSVKEKSNRLDTQIVGVVDGNKIIMSRAVMTGNQPVIEKPSCKL